MLVNLIICYCKAENVLLYSYWLGN